MKKHQIMTLIIVYLLSNLLVSCASKEMVYEFDLGNKQQSLPSGIYYDHHIYWKMSETIKEVEGEKVGSLHSTANENCFPSNEFMGTYDLKFAIESDIYKKDQNLYLKTKEGILLYQYLTETELLDEVKSFGTDEETVVGMIAPHFVYEDMMYFTTHAQPVKHPSYFKKAEEIKEQFARGKRNYTGNIAIGDEVYATDFQNRFMLVKHKKNQNFYLFDNEAYRRMKD